MSRPPPQPRNTEAMQVDEAEGYCEKIFEASDAKDAIVVGETNVLGDPSNVEDDLEKLLSSRVNFSDSFSFYRHYSDAPNPAMNLSGLGGVGLPLSVREAQSIKSQFATTDSEDEKMMIVNDVMRAALELDHSLVSFENPKWRKFVTRIAQDVCAGLGIDFKLHKPRCDLRRLFLVEPNSQLYFEEPDDNIVNIAVVLPSECTGGMVCTSHQGVFKTHDCTSETEIRTQVVAWYSNATCHFEQLTSGFRLALSYRLVSTTRVPWPDLRKSSDMTADLYRILHAWKAAEGTDTPNKIIYLLEENYPRPKEIRFDRLKNTDLRKVDFLRRVAERLEFGIGLATVYGRLSGYCEEDETDADPPFESVDDDDIGIGSFVDLEGRLISETLSYEEHEVIPSVDLVDFFHDDVTPYEVEKPAENFVVRHYSRTAVVLWPHRSNFAIPYSGPEGFARACEELSRCRNPIPSDRDTALAEFVLAGVENYPYHALTTLCSVSFTWKNPTWWNKALSKDDQSGGRRVITDRDKFKAIERFGFEVVRVGIESMLEHYADDASRLAFLFEMHKWTSGSDSQDSAGLLAQPILDWIAARTQPLFDTMISAPKPADCASIVQTALMSGGLALLQLRVKYLLERCDDYMLAEFAQQIIKVFPDSPERQSIAAALLTAAIAKAEFVPLPLSSGLSRPVRDPAVAIEVCWKARCDHLIPIIVDRVLGATYLPAAEAQACSRGIMLPLLQYLIGRRSQSVAVTDALEKLRQPTLTLFVDFLEIHPDDVDAKAMTTLVQGAAVENDFKLFDAIVLRLDELSLPADALRTVVEVVHSNRGLFGTPDMQERHVRPVSLLFGLKYASAVKFGPRFTLLNFCDWALTSNMPELVDAACKRTLNPRSTTIGEVRRNWLPLVPELHKLGARHNALDALAPAFQAIASAWLDKTMMTPPNTDLTLSEDLRNLKRWECKCQYCKAIREFLVQTDRTNRLERIGVSMSRHVEMQVLANAKSLATTKPIGSTPQGITVSKSEELFRLVWWRMKQTRGREMLKSIGANHDQLRRLLGPVYQRAIATVYGNLPNPTPVPASSAVPLQAALPLAGPAFSVPAQVGAQAARARVTSSPAHALASQSSTNGHRYPPPAASSAYARNVSTSLHTATSRTTAAYAAASARAAPISARRDIRFIPDGPVAKKAKTSHLYK